MMQAERHIFTTDEKPYPHYGLASYRIEIDLTDHHHPLQRHIWTDESGAVSAEDWIRTSRETPESLSASGYTRKAA